MPKEVDVRSVSIGRNLSQRGSPGRLVGAICALVPQGLTVEEASELVL
jgi:DhnA family fructose-bisphosphate aldolase class Ia